MLKSFLSSIWKKTDPPANDVPSMNEDEFFDPLIEKEYEITVANTHIKNWKFNVRYGEGRKWFSHVDYDEDGRAEETKMYFEGDVDPLIVYYSCIWMKSDYTGEISGPYQNDYFDVTINGISCLNGEIYSRSTVELGFVCKNEWVKLFLVTDDDETVIGNFTCLSTDRRGYSVFHRLNHTLVVHNGYGPPTSTDVEVYTCSGKYCRGIIVVIDRMCEEEAKDDKEILSHLTKFVMKNRRFFWDEENKLRRGGRKQAFLLEKEYDEYRRENNLFNDAEDETSLQEEEE